jgi:hypothetical protein
MKSSILIIFLTIIFFSVFTYQTNAFTKKSFGGKIISTTIPSVTCVGQGPITLSKMTGGLPLAIAAQNSKSIANPMSKILGRYSLVPDSTICQQQTPAGPVPFPVYKIEKNYGTSKF